MDPRRGGPKGEAKKKARNFYYFSSPRSSASARGKLMAWKRTDIICDKVREKAAVRGWREALFSSRAQNGLSFGVSLSLKANYK